MAQLLAKEASPDGHRLDVTNTSVLRAAERVLHLSGWLLATPAEE